MSECSVCSWAAPLFEAPKAHVAHKPLLRERRSLRPKTTTIGGLGPRPQSNGARVHWPMASLFMAILPLSVFAKRALQQWHGPDLRTSRPISFSDWPPAASQQSGRWLVTRLNGRLLERLLGNTRQTNIGRVPASIRPSPRSTRSPAARPSVRPTVSDLSDGRSRAHIRRPCHAQPIERSIITPLECRCLGGRIIVTKRELAL